MTAEALLETLRRAGAEVYAEDARVWVQPAEVLDDELRAEIRAHKPLLLMLLLPEEVRWRAEAMLPQVPTAGPIRGLLAARDGAWPAEPWRCASCSEWIDPSSVASRVGPTGPTPSRCALCREAALVAIELGRGRR